MRKIIFMVFLCFHLAMNAQAKKKADKETERWRYEVECVGVGKPGTNLLKVWSYSRKTHIAIEQSKKNAVHAIIFKGFSKGINGCFSQKALVKDFEVERKNQKFFKEFFKLNDGLFRRFVQITQENGITNNDVIKLKKEYKIGVLVLVDRDALRKFLEDNKIIKGLSSGF